MPANDTVIKAQSATCCLCVTE